VIRPETPVVGTWDRDRLGQVLDNLLGNAVKYSPQGKEIVVRVAIVDGEARLCVRDQGDGIPAATLPSLFERFFRADNAGSASGLGLGLYIARMLVEAHGGRIWATSEPGEGSVFTIALPLES
jgi:signal transduction histidine kinase